MQELIYDEGDCSVHLRRDGFIYIYTHTFFFNFIFSTNGWFKFEIHQGGKSGPLFHSIHTSQFQVDYRSTCEKGSSSQKTHRRVAARFGD